jgi:gas vesicle protein
LCIIAREAKEKIRRLMEEYQKQNIQAAREITDNYIESQKQIINSLQAWLPQIEAANRVFTSTSWMSPRDLADNYARVVSNIADNTVTATRLFNNAIIANLETFKRSIQNIQEITQESSQESIDAGYHR